MRKVISQGILLLIIAVFGIQIFYYAVNIPFGDDFDAVLNFLNEWIVSDNFTQRLALLFSQHNEHKILLVRLFVLIDYYLFGSVNFVHLILIGNLFLLGSIAIIFRIANSNETQWNAFDWMVLIPIAFFVLSIQSHETLLWGMASIQNIGVIFFTFLTFFVLLKGPLNSYRFIVGMFSAFIAIYSSGNGFLCLPVIMVMFIFRKEKLNYNLLWILFSIVVLYSYFHNYHSHPGHPDPKYTLFNEPDKLIAHLFILLGNSWAIYKYEMLISIVVGVVVLLLTFYLISRNTIAKQPLKFAYLSFLFLSCCVTSLSRAGFGADQALSLRYRIYSLLILVFLYLVIFEFINDDRRKFRFVIVVIAVSFINHFVSIWNFQGSMRDHKRKLMHGLAAFNENNRYFYLSYPEESRARMILTNSYQLGVYNYKPGYLEFASKKVKVDPAPTDNIDYDFGFEDYDDLIIIDNGWAYIDGFNTENNQTYIVLKSDSLELTFDTYWHVRPDVTAAKGGHNLDRSGLTCLIPKSQIPDGKYRIGVLIKKSRRLRSDIQAFELTNKFVVRSGDNFQFPVDALNEIQFTSGESSHYIDSKVVVNDTLEIRGWVVIRGTTSDKIRKELNLVSTTGEVMKVAPRIESRPDVSNALVGSYSGSGFVAKIPIALLNDQEYEIDLLLEYFSEKRIIKTGDRILLNK
ncbi:MAG: hypothetical protein RIB47_11500 [Cyclobacteriaceae bacterium]